MENFLEPIQIYTKIRNVALATYWNKYFNISTKIKKIYLEK